MSILICYHEGYFNAYDRERGAFLYPHGVTEEAIENFARGYLGAQSSDVTVAYVLECAVRDNGKEVRQAWREFHKHVAYSMEKYFTPCAPTRPPACGYLNDMGRYIIEVNKANGWSCAKLKDWKGSRYKIPALLALITSETSEALEAFRKDDKENFAEEMADQLIRILDLTAGLGIDIDQAVATKIEANKSRGYHHGGKRV